jgi:hypothetical protein
MGECFFTSLLSKDLIIPQQIPSTLMEWPKDSFEEIAQIKGGQPPRWLVLTPDARSRLARVFGRFHLDLASLRFALRVMRGLEGRNYGDSMYLFPGFGRLWYEEQLGLLAHEITHALQVKILGGWRCFLRFEREKRASNGDPYVASDRLESISVEAVDPVSPQYYLEQIADRFGHVFDPGL